MASFSPESAQIRVLGGATSSRNVFFRKTSLKYSDGGVSFGLLSPRSSFLPLKTGSYNRRTANSIIPVAAVSDGGASWSSAKEIETLARILKERAEIFAGTSTQLPDDDADEIARLAMEAAEKLFITSRDKFARISTQFSRDQTPFLHNSYFHGAEYRRFLNEEARRIAKEVAHMFARTSTQLLDDAANEVETKERRSEDIDAENHAASSDDSWSRYDEAKRAPVEAAERLAKEAANMLAGESKQLPGAADDVAERLATEAAERLVREAADMFAGASSQLQKLVGEAAKMFSSDDTKEKRSDDHVDNENNAASAVAGLVDEVRGLMKPYVTRVQDYYDVGDYIWTRIGTDEIEGKVISKDYNVTRLEAHWGRTAVIDNHKLTGWIQIRN